MDEKKIREELKKCPFCGGEAYIHETKEDFLGIGFKVKGYAVVCTKCHSSTEYDKRQDVCIKAWNRRVDDK